MRGLSGLITKEAHGLLPSGVSAPNAELSDFIGHSRDRGSQTIGFRQHLMGRRHAVRLGYLSLAATPWDGVLSPC
jgi:hypothetical protein